MSSAGASAAPRARAPLRLPLIAVVVIVLVAGVGGLIVGAALKADAPRPVAPARAAPHVSKAGVRLQAPVGWHLGGSVAVAGFKQPLRLHNLDNRARAAIELRPAESATLLPAALRDVVRSPETVRLGTGYKATRYRFADASGTSGVLYVAPTTAGVATIACVNADTLEALDGCRAVAAGVAVPGARRLAPGGAAAFLIRLPGVVRDLGAARADGGRALAAATRFSGQAAAAARLARAHRSAAAALAPLTGKGIPAATVAALTATASSYAALASAARARVPQRYAVASAAVANADRDLQQTIAKAAGAQRSAVGAPAQAAVARAGAPATASPWSGTSGTGGGSGNRVIFLITIACVLMIIPAIRAGFRDLR